MASRLQVQCKDPADCQYTVCPYLRYRRQLLNCRKNRTTRAQTPLQFIENYKLVADCTCGLIIHRTLNDAAVWMRFLNCDSGEKIPGRCHREGI